MRITSFFLVLPGLLLLLASCSSQSTSTQLQSKNTRPWHLVNGESRLDFISIKKGTVAETHNFGQLAGTVASDGTVQIDIVLDSVETYIDIRNERMRTYLFETDKTPNARLKANLEMAQFSALNTGERKIIDIPVNIDLHGQTDTMAVALSVTRLGENRVIVNSLNPVIVEADTFALLDGIEKLRELAKLPSISPVVPVTFSLVFER